MKTLLCATYDGLDAKVVQVESTLTRGLPSFSIVGMANTSISESKERCKSALLSNDFKFPPKRITINLAPSDIKKDGSQFDLGIALLIALNDAKADLDGWFVFGELGLDGAVKENAQLYPLMLSLANQKLIKKVIVPSQSIEKVCKIPDIEIYGVSTLQEAIDLLEDQQNATPIENQSDVKYPFYELNSKKYFYTNEYLYDFLDVRGQEVAKRAALICAVGMHNIIFEGSPGCGKSMIASRMQYILPPMDRVEILDKAKLEVLEGIDPDFKPIRNFKNPHHTSTSASVFGGGSHKAKIGEVGLSHNGILFFDELPHFSKNILEALREPMQDQKIRISRVNSKVHYPASFLFIGAMNPCPCGNLLDEHKECRCSELEISRYKNRLSDPFLDRIDIYVTMQQVDKNDKPSISSKEMHQQVIEAHKFAKKREQKEFNAKLSDKDIEVYCTMDDEATDLLEIAITRFNLSFRSIKKVRKVARSIADLVCSDMIKKEHIMEALSYRKR